MSYHLVTVFHVPSASAARDLEEMATHVYGCQGIEEYSLDEPQVDALLGERSYSGGDLPFEVLEEVDQAMMKADIHLKFFFSSEALGLAEEFAFRVRSTQLSEVHVETLADQDWNAEWKKHYRPIHITEQLVVLPEWNDPRAYAGKLVVRIHPGMGFGTGSHETTHLCLRAFMGCDLGAREKVVLDYGSGSGILGIAALVRDSQATADFVDIDPEAHRNCRQNLDLNSIDLQRSRLLLVEDRGELRKSYPIVFANILQNILHQECQYLISKTAEDGFLILSGLLKSQVEETKELYLASGALELVKLEVLNDWGCVLLRKLS